MPTAAHWRPPQRWLLQQMADCMVRHELWSPLRAARRQQCGMTGAMLCAGIQWQVYACAAGFALALAIVALTVTVIITRPLTTASDYRLRFLVVSMIRALLSLGLACNVQVASGLSHHAAQVGDWGRDGLFNQSLVAQAMGRVAQDLDFVVSVGDNFYESGIVAVTDTQFESSFSGVYRAESLQVTIWQGWGGIVDRWQLQAAQ